MIRTFANLVHVARGSVGLFPFLALVIAFAAAQGLAFLAVIPVVDAVVRGDADAARSAVRVHLGRSLASLPRP